MYETSNCLILSAGACLYLMTTHVCIYAIYSIFYTFYFSHWHWHYVDMEENMCYEDGYLLLCSIILFVCSRSLTLNCVLEAKQSEYDRMKLYAYVDPGTKMFSVFGPAYVCACVLFCCCSQTLTPRNTHTHRRNAKYRMHS